MLAFIAAFVFLGAQQELAYARLRETAQGLRVGQAMITRFQDLADFLKVAEIAASLPEAVNRFSRSWTNDSASTDSQTERNLQRRLTNSRPRPRQTASHGGSHRVTLILDLKRRLELMQQSSEPLLPVVNASGQIVGLVSVGHLAELSASKQPGLSL